MWPWELYEMLNLAAAVERAGEFDIIHYEAAVLPDVARIHAPVADADRPDAPSFAERAPKSRCGRATPKRLSSRSPNEQRMLLDRRERRRHRAARDRHRQLRLPRNARTTTCCFSGRFTEGKGVLQAIEVARRVGMKLMLAAAEDDYYREKVAPHVDGTHIVYYGEADFDGEGEAVRRRARARSTRCRRASRSASCWPKPWRAALRSSRSISAPSAKSSTTA